MLGSRPKDKPPINDEVSGAFGVSRRWRSTRRLAHRHADHAKGEYRNSERNENLKICRASILGSPFVFPCSLYKNSSARAVHLSRAVGFSISSGKLFTTRLS